MIYITKYPPMRNILKKLKKSTIAIYFLCCLASHQSIIVTTVAKDASSQISQSASQKSYFSNFSTLRSVVALVGTASLINTTTSNSLVSSFNSGLDCNSLPSRMLENNGKIYVGGSLGNGSAFISSLATNGAIDSTQALFPATKGTINYLATNPYNETEIIALGSEIENNQSNAFIVKGWPMQNGINFAPTYCKLSQPSEDLDPANFAIIDQHHVAVAGKYTDDPFIEKINLSNCSSAWHNMLVGLNLISEVSITNNKEVLIAVGATNTSHPIYFAINATTGMKIWEQILPGNGFATSVFITPTEAIISGEENNQGFVVNATLTNGMPTKYTWLEHPNSTIYTNTLIGNNLFIGGKFRNSIINNNYWQDQEVAFISKIDLNNLMVKTRIIGNSNNPDMQSKISSIIPLSSDRIGFTGFSYQESICPISYKTLLGLISQNLDAEGCSFVQDFFTSLLITQYNENITSAMVPSPIGSGNAKEIENTISANANLVPNFLCNVSLATTYPYSSTTTTATITIRYRYSYIYKTKFKEDWRKNIFLLLVGLETGISLVAITVISYKGIKYYYKKDSCCNKYSSCCNKINCSKPACCKTPKCCQNCCIEKKLATIATEVGDYK